jgi:hypothetical protein
MLHCGSTPVEGGTCHGTYGTGIWVQHTGIYLDYCRWTQTYFGGLRRANLLARPRGQPCQRPPPERGPSTRTVAGMQYCKILRRDSSSVRTKRDKYLLVVLALEGIFSKCEFEIERKNKSTHSIHSTPNKDNACVCV